MAPNNNPVARPRRARLPSLRNTPTPGLRGTPSPSPQPAAPAAAVRKLVRTCAGCSEPDIQEHDGQLVCLNCGTVASDSVIVNDVTFGEAPSGAALVQGTTIHDGERTTRPIGIGFRRGGLTKEETFQNAMRAGKDELTRLANVLHITGVLDLAVHLYTLARLHQFQRPIKENAAVCLYIACRKERGNTTMLIDLAEQIKMNVYDLGATYKKFVKSLDIENEIGDLPIIEIEPIIYKFAQRLEFGDATRQVAADAAAILARMDRDWMVTGRQPMGLCGACLLLAARMNNFRRTLREVVYVVRAGEVTILKRLNEFQATEAGRMHVKDFREKSHLLPYAADPPSFSNPPSKRRKLSALQLGDDESVTSDGASTRQNSAAPRAPSELRRDADGFLIPNPPVIDPNLPTPDPSQSTGRATSFSIDTNEDDSEEEEPKPRKRGRPRKERPEPLVLSEEELLAENQLEAEISAIVARKIAEEDSEPFKLSFARAKALAEAEKDKQRQASTWQHSSVPDTETIDEDEFEDDPEVANCLLDAREVEAKEKIWVTANYEWLRDQQAKLLREQMEEAKGKRKKQGPRRKMGRRGDGSVLGSTPVSSPAEASQRMLEKRAGHRAAFSKHLNYDKLKAIYGGDDESTRSGSPTPSTTETTYSRASSRSVSASPAPRPALPSARMMARTIARDGSAAAVGTQATRDRSPQATAGASRDDAVEIEDDGSSSDAETIEEEGDIGRTALPTFDDVDDDDLEEVEEYEDDDHAAALAQLGDDYGEYE